MIKGKLVPHSPKGGWGKKIVKKILISPLKEKKKDGNSYPYCCPLLVLAEPWLKAACKALCGSPLSQSSNCSSRVQTQVNQESQLEACKEQVLSVRGIIRR